MTINLKRHKGQTLQFLKKEKARSLKEWRECRFNSKKDSMKNEKPT